MEELSLILALSALKKAQELGKVLSPKKVDSLPPVGEEGILYFVPKLNPSTMDACDEYIWDSDRSSYELVGSTDMDSDIVKRIEDLEDEVSDVPHSEEVTDYTDVEPPTVDADILGGRITAEDVEELQDYATELKQDLTQLSANISDAYSPSKTYYNGDLVIYNNELWKYDKVGASGTSIAPSDSVASRTSLGNEINTKNNLGQEVDLKSYVTTYFTFPHDGYVYLQSRAVSGANISCRIYGGDYGEIAVLNNANSNGAEQKIVPVKKGMKTRLREDLSPSNTYYMYIPLI